MSHSSFYHRPAKAKLIAMIDLFAFLLILLLFVVLNNPSKNDLNDLTKQISDLRSRNDLLSAKIDKARDEKDALIRQNELIRAKLENMRAALQEQRNVRELLMHHFEKQADILFPELHERLNSGEMTFEEAFSFLLKATNTLVKKLDEEEAKKVVQAALEEGEGGNFKAAKVFFSAGDFKQKPVDEFRNLSSARKSVSIIILQYKDRKDKFPYIFVIGHANSVDVLDAPDPSISARRKRNWQYAMRRAVTVTSLLEQQLVKHNLPESIMDNVIIASTGEFDQRYPASPYAEENAWVEVIFCRDWKPPARFNSLAFK